MVSLDQLMKFNISGLQRSYFKFMLPTFEPQKPTMHAADRHWEKQRVLRFLNAGVMGLRAMDEQRLNLRAKSRHALVLRQRSQGSKAAIAVRTGCGPSLTFIAYKEMNSRVTMALGKLMERELRDLSVFRST